MKIGASVVNSGVAHKYCAKVVMDEFGDKTRKRDDKANEEIKWLTLDNAKMREICKKHDARRTTCKNLEKEGLVQCLDEN